MGIDDTLAVLTITDGDEEISLIKAESDAFYLDDWRPRVVDFKDGGVFSESSLADGRRLIDYRFGTVQEEYALKIKDVDPDALILETQKLRRLLLKAADYWVTGSNVQNSPVWIETKAKCETNKRYATIVSFQVPSDGNPFGQPFMAGYDGAVFDAWTLILERGDWKDVQPHSSTCVKINDLHLTPTVETITASPLQSADDGYANVSGTSISNGGNFLYTGSNPTSFSSYIRFPNIQLPADAGIVRAYITFTAANAQAGVTINSDISADDADNSAQIASYADYAGRTDTTAVVSWSPGAWVQGTTYESPDIKSVIQEIVDRAGWASGNAIQIFWKNAGSSNGAYRQPASFDNATYDEAVLTIEYISEASGTPRTDGHAETCDAAIFVGNKQVVQGLTHIFVSDGGVFGGNLLDAALPYALLPAVPAASDAVYFGIASGAADVRNFDSLVFNLSQAGASTLQWQYYNTGTGWTALPATELDDNTAQLTTLGASSVTWVIRSIASGAWDATTVNGIDGFWIRALDQTGGAQPPIQQSNHPYTITTAFADIDDAQVPGDIPAIAYYKIIQNSFVEPVTTVAENLTRRVLIGLRTKSRGSNFSAYINLASKNNQSGITVTAGTDSAFNSDDVAPANESILLTTSTLNSWITIGTIAFTSALAQEYNGRFHAYLRGFVNATGSALISFRLRAKVGERITYTSDAVQFTADDAQQILDMREFSFPGVDIDDDESLSAATIDVQAYATGAAETAWLRDIILMPVDEWFASYSVVPLANGGGVNDEAYLSQISADGQYLEVNPFIEKFGTVKYAKTAAGAIFAIWKGIESRAPLLQANVDQRLWFLTDEWTVTVENVLASYTETNHIVQVNRQSRYLSMRGGR